MGNATWYVRDQKDVVSYEGAESAIAAGALCKARNKALNDAHGRGLPCIQLSDDLTRLERVFAIRKLNKTVTIPFDMAVATMLNAAQRAQAFLAGVAPTTNKLFFNPSKAITLTNFIVGDFILVRPSPLRFDEEMRLKEDYDFTLQHLKSYGRVARCNNIFAYFSHRKNAGGAVGYRTAELEQEMIAHLKRKWNHHIRDNPKRPNEVILKW